MQAVYGSHCIFVYPDLRALRKVYAKYTKLQLENNNIVLLLPFYETTDSVRQVLSEYHDNSIINLDVRKYEKEGSLVIIDSQKAYFGSAIVDIMTFVQMLIDHAKHFGKNGVCIMADMGSFYYRNHSHDDKINQLVKYETSLPSKFDIKLKGFCCYHKKDFDRLNRLQMKEVLEHHGRQIMVTNN